MNCKIKIVCLFFWVSIGFNSYSVVAQSTISSSLKTQLKALHKEKQYDSMVAISSRALKNKVPKNAKDSLLFATLHLYEYEGLYKSDKYEKATVSLEKGIQMCPSSHAGDSLKAVFYNNKAYRMDTGLKSYKSISNSLKLLEKIPNPNPGYIMGGYLLLSSHNAYYGNFDKAKQYMRLAEDTYAKNKAFIDKNTWELNGNNHRLGVIAKYRKIFLFYSLSKESKDSLQLINTMNQLEKMHRQPDFHKEESIYYSTSLNHVGDWFISNQPDSLTSPKSVSLGLSYLFKALDLVENKGYPGTIWAIKYNIAKGFIRGNQLQKADSTMASLFQGISPTDGRLPFFLAQKALIKAKKQQKDSALLYFYKSIQKIHKGEQELKNDYSNFKPSTRYNHTRLLLRINEELSNYYAKDTLVQKNIARLYYLALQQFENSYLDTNFNAKQNKELRQIIRGILKTNRTGFLKPLLPQKKVLEKYESFRNQLAWKKFYENRYTNILPELDSIKQRQVVLTSLLNKAKISDNITQKDSIQQLIYKHEAYKKQLFPQLALLSDFTFSVQDLQKSLSENDLVLKYIVLANEIAIYQISKYDFKVQLLPWSQKKKELINSFIESTHKRNYSSEIATELGDFLIPTIDDKITNLIVNPDEVLFKLPFEILQTKGNQVSALYNVRYTSNLGFVHYPIERTSRTKDIHIYAPKYTNSSSESKVRGNATYLKGANSEAKMISKLFPSKLFNNEALTKASFLETVGDAKLLHLAMHAEVDSDYPEFSRLLFSSNFEKDDEHLYLEELYGLSLSADLAILSACNTGAGLEKNGNIESFQRAFTFAGVPATVASLWEVPDSSTEQIMVLFYENLKTGQTKSEALKNAKLSFVQKNAGTKLAAPYFWAGFVVYGNDTPIANNGSPFLYYILLAIFLAMLVFWLRRRANQ